MKVPATHCGVSGLVMAASKLEPPRFFDDAAGYPEYKRKLERWSRITKIAQAKQAEYVVYHLEDHPSGIQEKIDIAIGADIEDAVDGMGKLIKFLDEIYAEDEMSEAWNKYKDFIRLKRDQDQPVTEFIAEFDKKHKRAKESGCQFSDMVLGFNLLESCQLSETDEKFILIDVDFKTGKEQENLLSQIKNSLRKFQGRDRLRDGKENLIKTEDTFVSSVKEALLADGWTPPGSSPAGPSVRKNSAEYKGKKNPLDSNGNPLRCFKCQSEYHMSDRCDKQNVKDSSAPKDDKINNNKKKKKKKRTTDAAALSVVPENENVEGTELSKILARVSMTEFNMVCGDFEDPCKTDKVCEPIILSDLLSQFCVTDVSAVADNRTVDEGSADGNHMSLQDDKLVEGEMLSDFLQDAHIDNEKESKGYTDRVSEGDDDALEDNESLAATVSHGALMVCGDLEDPTKIDQVYEPITLSNLLQECVTDMSAVADLGIADCSNTFANMADSGVDIEENEGDMDRLSDREDEGDSDSLEDDESSAAPDSLEEFHTAEEPSVARCNTLANMTYSGACARTDMVFVSLDEQELCMLIEEAGCRGVLDTACSRSVAGFGWVQKYTNAVSPSFSKSLKVLPSSKIYQFGGGEKRQSYGKVSLPVVIGEKKVIITIEMVQALIPLLIGSNSMKLGEAILNFKNSTAVFFDEVVDMMEVGAGHFCISLLAPHVETHINDVDQRNGVIQQVLVTAEKVDIKLLKKLHHYYGHTPPDRLLKLLKNAGKEIKELRKPLLDIENSCEACARTKKRPPKPKSSIPRVDSANVIVTLDLKEWCFKRNKKYICYMIDLFSRLTMGNFINDKNPSSIVECILSTWVPAFGMMQGIHSDIGGEFSNSVLEEVASRLGVIVTTTASYSPHQNGLNERNHAIVDMMIKRMLLSEPSLKPQMALLWALNAKNSLENYHGFTPFQLHIGRTPMLPSTTRDGPPAFENITKSENFAAHLNALHAARREFVKAESSQSLKLAMKSKVHPRGDDIVSGDEIYYKQKTLQKSSPEWNGPSKVVATNGKKLFVDKGARLGTVNRDDSVRKGEELWKFSDVISKRNNNTVSESVARVLRSSQSRLKQSATKVRVTHSSSSESGEDSISEPVETDVSEENEDNEDSESGEDSLSDEHVEVSEENEDNVDDVSDGEDEDESDLSEGEESSAAPDGPEEFLTAEEGDREEQLPDQLVSGTSAGGNNTSLEEVPNKCSGRDITKNDIIYYIIPETGVAETSIVLSRASKASGKKHWWNVQVKKTGRQKSVNLEAVKDLHKIVSSPCDTDTSLVVSIPRHMHHDSECVEAKEKELKNWDQFGAYQEVPDEGQPRINTNWVLVRKGTGLVKARLCVRGDQEPNQDAIRTDSPTVNKVNIKLFFVIAVHQGWHVKTADIKAAFLQGSDLDRAVYVRPPVERRRKGYLWKMIKRAYGFIDASRGFYLELRKVLEELGCVVCKLDPAMFLYFGNHCSLQGLLLTHVDDLMHGAGTSEFNDYVLVPLKQKFTFGSEDEDDFKYVGMHVRQVGASIVCDQDTYIENMEIPYTDFERNKDMNDLLDIDGQSDFRSAVGRIGWVSSSSRPDLAFHHLLLSTRIGHATVRDMKFAVKAVKQIKCDVTTMKFVPLGPVSEWVLEGYGDAGHKSLPDKLSSSCGYVLLLRNKVSGATSVLSWKSTKIRRVVASSTAAEALATVETSDALMYISAVLKELLGDVHIPLHLFTDSKNLHNSVHTSALVDDQRMRVDIARLKESVEKGEISQFSLIGSGNMLADVLTKKGAAGFVLLNVLRNGQQS